MKKNRLLFLTWALATAALVLADPVAVVVTEQISQQINLQTGTTNSTYTFTFTIPQPCGQLQDSVAYTSPPSSATVSNDIVARAASLLSQTGTVTNNVTVQLP